MFEQAVPQNLSVLKVLPDDAYAEIIFTSGKKRKQEFQYGSSYLSQSSRVLVIPPGIKEIHVVNVSGHVRKIISN